MLAKKKKKEVNYLKSNSERLEEGTLVSGNNLELFQNVSKENLNWIVKNDILGKIGRIWNLKNIPVEFKKNMKNFWEINFCLLFTIFENGPR